MNDTNKTTRRGRPRKGTALRVPICFSIDPAVLDMARVLRHMGLPLNDMVENLIVTTHAAQFCQPHLECD